MYAGRPARMLPLLLSLYRQRLEHFNARQLPAQLNLQGWRKRRSCKSPLLQQSVTGHVPILLINGGWFLIWAVGPSILRWFPPVGADSTFLNIEGTIYLAGRISTA